MARILIVDDDTTLTLLLGEWLEAENHQVQTVSDGQAARVVLSSQEFDVVLLDWDLPYATGLDLCREYRAKGGAAVVVLLTGRAHVTEKELGFEAGADDYLTKPFSPRELSARLKALLRRVTTPSESAGIEQVREQHSATDSRWSASILQRYELLDCIGQGAMGLIYKARHKEMGRIVALKMLHQDLTSSRQSLARFKLEAQAVASFSHPNIITIFDYGVTPDGVPFIVMEYLDGTSLADILTNEHQLRLKRALPIFKQACDALAHAHAKGIIHRDLKPGNLMLVAGENGNERLKVLDFGIAKVVASRDLPAQQLTRAGEIFGSPLYMSPEQCAGEQLDARSDIFSLGCVFYECLTGVKVFLGENDLETMYRRSVEKPLPLSVIRPDLNLPLSLESVILKALAVRPHDRYQSMLDLKADLELITETQDKLQS